MRNDFITPIIKLSDGCNYNCQFCYYAQKKENLSNLIMPIELTKSIIHSALTFNNSKGIKKTHIIFHGGEPLLAGKDYFCELMEFEREILKQYPKLSFENSIETNGYMLDDYWIHFLKDNDFGVGISIDGPEDLNFHKRSIGDTDSEKLVLKKINRMNELNAPFGVMSVITNKHINKAKELYDFYVQNNIHNVGFCFCFNKDTDDSVDREGLIEFLKSFFNLYYYGKYKLRVREFEEIIKRILGKENNLCLFCNRERCGNYPTIDYCGNVFFCDFGTEKEKTIGNINHQSLEEIVESDKWIEEKQKSKSIISLKCYSCESKDICGKICYRSDVVLPNGEYRNYFCSVYPVIIRYIESIIM